MIEKWIQSYKAEGLWIEGEASGRAEHLTADSREVASTQKCVFFARKGITQDGHTYLKDLADKDNVLAFVVEEKPEGFSPKAPVIVVRDSTAAMAYAVKEFYADPTSQTYCVAVTGTNGKTTTTCLIQALLKQKGLRPARTGTIDTHFEDMRIPSKLTTPDFTQTQKLFAELKQKGADAFVFEASSHALEQRRLLGIDLDAAIFTNLSPEHLDYHKDMDDYFLAKKKVFTDYLVHSPKKDLVAIIRDDRSYGSRLIEEIKHIKKIRLIAWGFELPGPSDVERSEFLHIKKWTSELSGTSIQVAGLGLEEIEFRSKLIGRFNVENLVGVICLGRTLKMSAKEIQEALDHIPVIPGRLERACPEEQGSIFVDYAHTPDALENVLMALRPLTSGKLRVVFGCGGDRDRGKRPMMAEIAELHADELFVTSDNPRTEDPEKIIQDILKGLQRLKPVTINVDRRQAIQKSLEGLAEDDVVLIAGKGHEDYQILGRERIYFDDRKVVQEALGLLT